MLKDDFLPARISDAFVLLAITNDDFLHIIRNSVSPEHFSPKIIMDIIKICYNYWDNFKCAPNNHFHDELLQFLSKMDSTKKEMYINYLEKIQKLDLPNIDYIISKVNKFVQHKEFEQALIKAYKFTESGKIEEARNIIQSALRVGIIKEEVGLKYFERTCPTYLMPDKRESHFVIPTGISLIDKVIPRGLCRTDFVCVLGNTKGGKSWACDHFGVQGLIQGRKVLHISHELSEMSVEMRYDMNLGGLTSERSGEEIDINLETFNKEKQILETQIVKRPSVYTTGKSMEVSRRCSKFGGELIIKKYPMAVCTMSEIMRYLDYLEVYEGFVPDIVINDYVEKMKIPVGEHRRDWIHECYLQSKRIADERKLLMITVSQTNRTGIQRRSADLQYIAEDIRKADTVDMLFSLMQTKEQKELERATFEITAGRDVPDGYVCNIGLKYSIGQFCTSCWPIKEKQSEDNND